MRKPFFSIIIAAYNLGKLVNQAIDSCINQKGIGNSEYEILVYNDGSTDDTLQYIEDFKDSANVKIINQTNVGLSATRNRGIEDAKGEYLLFLDGDDWLDYNALSILKSSIDGDTLIIFPMNYYYSTNHVEKRGYNLEEKIYNSKDLLKATLGHSQFHIIPSPNKCYCRKLLIENKIRFVNGILHEDNPFFIDCIYTYNSVKYIDNPIYYYRQNRVGSITSACTLRNFNGVIKGIKHIEELTGRSNKDINFLLANLHVFQIISHYSSKKDEDTVIKYYRSVKIKLDLVKLLFSSTFRIKHTIRMLLALVDPIILKKTLRIYYE